MLEGCCRHSRVLWGVTTQPYLSLVWIGRPFHATKKDDTRFVVESNAERKFIIKKIGLSWKIGHRDLYKAWDNRIRSREEIIEDLPEGVQRNDWAIYVWHYQGPHNLERVEKNYASRQRQTLNHTRGIKSLARKGVKMATEHGRPVSRVEI